MINTKVAFRVDANKTLGMGHLNRCLSIAKQLKIKNINPIFIVRNQVAVEFIHKFDYEVVIIPRGENEIIFLKEILKFRKCKILIIDSKRKTVKKIIEKLKSCSKIILIDNVINSKFVDLIILPGIKEQFKIIPKNSICGSDYILLNPNFKKFTKQRNKRILLTTGSSDKICITIRVLKGFLKMKKPFNLDIVIGPLFSNHEIIKKIIYNDKRFKIIESPGNLSEVLATNSIGIMTFGITVYEAAVQKLPTFLISHSDENTKSAQKIEKYGCSKFIGKYDKIDYEKLANDTILASKNTSLLKKMSIATNHFDENGAKRTAVKIIELLKNKKLIK
jgi:UDP-2,4-diacetamido-2,4,6-trideoxy-beta-L-altropyranose hydrolase